MTRKSKQFRSTAVCAYCVSKGFRGLGHVEERCRTKAHDTKEAKKAKEAADVTIENYAFVVTATSNVMDGWIFDTAATTHMTPQKELVKNLHNCPQTITIRNRNEVCTSHISTLII